VFLFKALFSLTMLNLRKRFADIGAARKGFLLVTLYTFKVFIGSLTLFMILWVGTNESVLILRDQTVTFDEVYRHLRLLIPYAIFLTSILFLYHLLDER
jgi:hypothetical protein